MKAPQFERSGWSRVDISPAAQARIEAQLAVAGIGVQTLDVAASAAQFEAWRRHPEYQGEYRRYPGDLAHCLDEKALEHYLSVVLAGPEPGMTAIDVGSCRSVVPDILRRAYGVRCLEQDLSYPAGVDGDRVGGSADDMPLADGSVDFMTLHCTFEHFEGSADTGFMAESGRLLREGGRTVILPLYLNGSHCNVTGVSDPETRAGIGWDPEAEHYCEIPEWQDRFGRHYSVKALLERVIEPARGAGLLARMVKVVNWDAVDPRLWLRWALVLERAPRAANASTRTDPRLAELKALRGELAALTERMRSLEARSEADGHERNYLRAELAEARRQFDLVEADRAARGRVIEEQGRRTVELEALVHLTEKNRDWHKADAERLGAELETRVRVLGEELEDLRRLLAERDGQLRMIETRAWYRVGRRLRLL